MKVATRAVKMTYAEDREAFERDIFKPPFFARMLERSVKYTDGLHDKGFFLKLALDNFWELRGRIKTSRDILKQWNDALLFAASSRPRWLVSYGPVLAFQKWVPCSELGGEHR